MIQEVYISQVDYKISISQLLTKSKPYLAFGELIDQELCIWIINDNGYRSYHPKKWFKTLEEVRDEKINIILE